MISRRKFVAAMSALPFSRLVGEKSKALAHVGLVPSASESETQDFTKFVKIAIGTGGHGHTYPGATVPFGMVQLSPDTYNDGWDWCSGYHHSDSSIMGFSHTHLSGTGASDMLDFLLCPAPVRRSLSLEPGRIPARATDLDSATRMRLPSPGITPSYCAISIFKRNLARPNTRAFTAIRSPRATAAISCSISCIPFRILR